MNNKRQRNEILKLEESDRLPYQIISQVAIPQQTVANAPEAFYTDINHALGQMVDNDLFIESKFNKLADYSVGLKSGETRAVTIGPNGYKYAIDIDGLLHIYRKEVPPLSDTFEVRIDGKGVNKIIQFDGYVACGTADGIEIFDPFDSSTETQSIYSYSECFDLFVSGNRLIAACSGSLRCFTGSVGSLTETYIQLNSRRIRKRYTEDSIVVQNTESFRTIRTPSDGGIDENTYLFSLPNSGVTYQDIRDFICLEPDSSIEADITTNNDLLVITSADIYIKNGSGLSLLIPSDEIGSDVELNRIFRYGKNDFMICSNKGVFRYKVQTATQSDVVVKMSLFEPAYDICQYTIKDDKQQYLAVLSNKIGCTTKMRRWTDVLSSDWLSGDAKDVRDINAISERYIYVATKDGLFGTDNRSNPREETVRFTEDDVFQMFQDNRENIAASISSALSAESESHIADEHRTGQKQIQYINETYMATDFSNLCAFSESTNDSRGRLISANNDLVYNIRTGTTSANDDIRVKIKNFTTNNKYVFVEADYTIKLWNSRVNEFNIFIPTTKTYYLGHNAGLNACDYSQDEVLSRSNLQRARRENANAPVKVDSAISSHYTDVQVEILSSQYDIENLLNLQINGNSLPLNIYVDNNSMDSLNQEEKMYHSFITPSIVRGVPSVTQTNNEYYRFNFACFGSDAQAINIMTTTSTTEYYNLGENMLSIIYHGNGGVEPDTGDDYYIQKLRLDSDGRLLQHQMTANRFVLADNMFYGWSKLRHPSAKDFDTVFKTYADTTISDTDFSRTTMHLYAVWLPVDWNKSHTEFHLEGD